MVVSVVSADQFLTDKHSALNWNWGNTDEIKKALNDVISDPVTHRITNHHPHLNITVLIKNFVRPHVLRSRFVLLYLNTPRAAGSLLHGFA